MSIKKQVIRNVFSNYIGYFFSAIISLIATPIIVNSLGNTQYGIWSVLNSITGYYGLLNLGVRSALTKYIAEYNAKNSTGEINRLINTSLLFFFIIAAIVMLISYVISIYFSKIFLTDNVNQNLIEAVILLVGFNISLSFMFQSFDTILPAFNRFDLCNIIGIISSILRYLLIIPVLKMGYGLIAMAVIMLITDLGTYCISVIYSKKIFNEMSIGFRYINKNSFKMLFSFGILNFMRHVSSVVLKRTDAIIIGIYLGAAMVAPYTIAESLIIYIGLIVKGITRVTLPLSSHLSAQGETDKIRRMMLLIPKYIFPFYIFIAIQFYFLGENFISLWLGDGFYYTYVIFCVFMIAQIGIMSHDTMIESVVGMGHNRFVSFLALIEAISNVLLSLYLVKIWGLVGVAIGSVIPMTISRYFIVPVYCCRLININFKMHLKNILLPAAVCSLPCILATYEIKEIISPTNYFYLAVDALLAFAVFSIFFYRFLEPEIKSVLKHAIRLKYLTRTKEIIKYR